MFITNNYLLLIIYIFITLYFSYFIFLLLIKVICKLFFVFKQYNSFYQVPVLMIVSSIKIFLNKELKEFKEIYVCTIFFSIKVISTCCLKCFMLCSNKRKRMIRLLMYPINHSLLKNPYRLSGHHLHKMRLKRARYIFLRYKIQCKIWKLFIYFYLNENRFVFTVF